LSCLLSRCIDESGRVSWVRSTQGLTVVLKGGGEDTVSRNDITVVFLFLL
jgi:hypothetical protein